MEEVDGTDWDHSESHTFVEAGKNVFVICENIENKVLHLSLQSLEQMQARL